MNRLLSDKKLMVAYYI